MLQQSFKMALKSIFSNKMRSFLTVLGVVIGVIAVVVLVSLVQGATGSILSSLENIGSNQLTVSIMQQRGDKLTKDDLAYLQSNENISYVAPYAQSSKKVKAGTSTYDATIFGTTQNYENIHDVPVLYGRFLGNADENNRSQVAVIGAEVADELFGARNVVGETILVEGSPFSVVGVLEEGENSIMGSVDKNVFIPFSSAQRLFKANTINSFYIATKDSDSVNAAQNFTEDFLTSKYDEDSYTVINQSALLDTINQTTSTLTLMLAGIAGISLLVGGIGIMNIMLVSVTERTREIGIRKAIGAARGAILTQFLIEAIVISLIGGLLGLGISAFLVAIIAMLMDITASISIPIVLIALGFSSFIGVLFGLYPANKASKLKPIDALRYE